MRKNIDNILIGVMFICGVGLLAHQRYMCGVGWFDWEQFLHHENMAVICFVSAISVLVGKHLKGK